MTNTTDIADANSSVPLSETARPTARPLPARLDLLLHRPTPRIVQLACLSTLIANTLIVVTGGAVRLTNSGLGCPTWPECTAGSLVPVPSLGYHGVIEFSNRLLTYAVTAAVAFAIIATMRQRPRRPILV